MTLTRFLGSLGRGWWAWIHSMRSMVEHISGVFSLFVQTLYHSFVAPFMGRTKLGAQLRPMLGNVGVKSFPIVFMISFLIGAILVIQTGPVMAQFGQIGLIPKMVALSMTREFGPVMTAIILTARVGASYTAVLASMKINDEVMALETMAIHPVGFLVAPRFLALLIMMPCLVIFSYAIGMLGGGLVAWQAYDIVPNIYLEKTMNGLMMADLYAGLAKGVIFSILISMICCYYGFITEGGPMGLGRNTMVAVVSTLVVVIIADALLGAFFMNYVFNT